MEDGTDPLGHVSCAILLQFGIYQLTPIRLSRPTQVIIGYRSTGRFAPRLTHCTLFLKTFWISEREFPRD